MNILEILQKEKKYQDIVTAIKEAEEHNNIYIGNCCINISKMIAALTFNETNNYVIYVCSDTFEASKAYEIFVDLLGTDLVSFFPVEEFISNDIVASSSEFKLARMLTISNIIKQKPQIIVTNTDGILKNVMSTKMLTDSILTYNVGQQIEINQITEDLIIRGYKKTAITTDLGTFSVRGSIVDIYPINADEPIRINFFDNEIETIKKINLETQLSSEKVKSVSVFPLYDIYYKKQDIPEIEKRILKKYPNDKKTLNIVDNLKEYKSLEQLYLYLPQIDENYQNILSFINQPVCFFENYNDLKSKLIFGTKGAEILLDNEYMMKRKGKMKYIIIS